MAGLCRTSRREVFWLSFGGLRSPNLLKQRLQHRCFLVYFCENFKNTLFKEHLSWLLLTVIPRWFTLCVFSRLYVTWGEAMVILRQFAFYFRLCFLFQISVALVLKLTNELIFEILLRHLNTVCPLISAGPQISATI